MTNETRSYGSWASPITAETLVQGAAGVAEIRVDGDDIWWSENRPGEGGRTQLVRRSPSGERQDLFPAFDPSGASPTWNARTAVHEYGGGAWAVRDGIVLFANWADQRLYRIDASDLDATPTPITPEPTTPRGARFSEPTWLDQDHFPGWIVCVRESHEPEAIERNGEAVNEIVALPVDGSAVEDPSMVVVLVSGPDFVHSPATHGIQLAWIQWDHPRMPWDGTEVCLAHIASGPNDEPAYLFGPGEAERHVLTGDSDTSIVQPGFLADGSLVYCSDRDGWWAPWRVNGPLPADPPPPEDHFAPAPMVVTSTVGRHVEIGGPLWVGGLRWWAEIAPGRLLVSMASNGSHGLGVLEPDGALHPLDTPVTELLQVVAGTEPNTGVVVAASPLAEPAPSLVAVTETARASTPAASLERLRPARDLPVDETWMSTPTHLTFASGEDRHAHALYYPPTNPTVTAPDGELPPLVVMIHGGPTSAVRNRLDLSKQFWTTRGFAVVDVNYGGSTGYGRPYRQLLQGSWGIVDVEDAAAAATHLAEQGLADPNRLAIRGGSAGGYTTLAALCFHDAFKAGASHYGVADLAALAADTHKFESRYLDGLVGPWPDARATYEERSPIHHVDGFDAPLIVLQGDEDEVVPPNQAEMIVDALRAKGVPNAYVLFEGEQHGFRKAENIVRALEAELWFYGRVFGFDPADDIEPVEDAVGLG